MCFSMTTPRLPGTICVCDFVKPLIADNHSLNPNLLQCNTIPPKKWKTKRFLIVNYYLVVGLCCFKPIYLCGDSALDEVDGSFHHDVPLLLLTDGRLSNTAAATKVKAKKGIECWIFRYHSSKSRILLLLLLYSTCVYMQQYKKHLVQTGNLEVMKTACCDIGRYLVFECVVRV